MTMALDSHDRHTLSSVRSNVIVPAHSTASFDEVLRSHPDIKQRSSLYFDEALRLAIILDFPTCSEQKLQSYLRNLELRVDAWVVPAQIGEDKVSTDGSASRDLIASEAVTSLGDPVTLVQESDDEGEVRLLLAWEVTLTLARQRIRSPDQTVVFVPVATIAGGENGSHDPDDFYLEPFTPLEPNVMSTMGPLPGIEKPFLPLSMLEKVIPAAVPKQDRIRLSSRASIPIPAYAAFIPRLKYTKLNVHQVDAMTVASLDLEVVPHAKVTGRIEIIDVALSSGKTTSLMSDFLPMSCKAQDCMTFLYQLQSGHQFGPTTPLEAATNAPLSNPNLDVLSIRIVMQLFISETTTATIRTSWTTNVDFSSALNPAFGAPSQTLQRTKRPTSLNFTPYPDPSNSKSRHRASTVTKSSARTASTSLQHQMIPSSIPRQPPSSVLSISFIAPDEPVHIGIPFSWRVIIVNNSPKPVKLAIVPLPRIQRPTNANQHFAKRHVPKASNSTIPAASLSKTHTRHAYGGSVAKAVVEEHVLYALHHQASSAGATAVPSEIDLISLTAELRVGPLGAKQCHEAEIKFLAYKTGVFTLDAIRVVDLVGESEGQVGVINDIRELPEIVVVEAEQVSEDGEGGESD